VVRSSDLEDFDYVRSYKCVSIHFCRKEKKEMKMGVIQSARWRDFKLFVPNFFKNWQTPELSVWTFLGALVTVS
jgi:hypothetical protein